MNCAHDLKGHQAPLLAVLRCMAAVVSVRGYKYFDLEGHREPKDNWLTTIGEHWCNW